MKTQHLLLISLCLILLISCSKDPIKKQYDSSNLADDLLELKQSLNENDYTNLTTLLDSLPQDQLIGNSYGEILKEDKKSFTVFDRFSKRYLKKNRVKKLGKKLSKKEEATKEEETKEEETKEE